MNEDMMMNISHEEKNKRLKLRKLKNLQKKKEMRFV
jgi:hypothetical protein